MSATTKFAIIAAALLAPILLLAYHSMTREDPALPKIGFVIAIFVALLGLGGGLLLITSGAM